MKSIALLICLIVAGSAYAESIPIIQISAKYCKEGVHKQPKGQFALYVFCDDALGTNISIFLNDLGAPLRGAYRLTNRFWQSDDWGADVTSFAWLPDNKSIIISTSAIYGSGKVFKLQLESKKVEIIYNPTPGEIENIEEAKIKIKVTNCELREKVIEVAI